MASKVIMLQVEGPEAILDTLEDFIEHTLHYQFNGKVEVTAS